MSPWGQGENENVIMPSIRKVSYSEALLVGMVLDTLFRDYFRTVMCFPKRGFRRTWCKERQKVPKTTTFTCSSRSRSCRVTLPLPRAANGHYPQPRYLCSRL
ncbi:tachykinin-like peptides receptor 86C [Caerostris darwini]|uniref:Tachykinin-like peptides receptor 86C n=1 Tax=Caerostris darwini TaxID=1538125 RepID=A0AAV4TJY5_9ARAC|nr:tachykinin-like peptides receptor 86C [Caerostris darwini]